MAVKQSGDEDGIFFFSSRRRHTRYWRDWSSDVCSSDLPPEGFKQDALVVDTSLHDEADQDYEGFWARQATELVTWFEEWHTILEWDLPFAKWFVGEIGRASCRERV